MKPTCFPHLVLGLIALCPAGSRVAYADLQYTIQPIARPGSKIGDFRATTDNNRVWPLGLSDHGKVGIVTRVAARSSLFAEYGDGRFTPVIFSGGDSPVGPWPKQIAFALPGGINRRGDMAIDVFHHTDEGIKELGLFLWDSSAHQVTAVARPGLPAVSDLTFTEEGYWNPVLNGRKELVFGTRLQDTAGEKAWALLRRAQDGRLEPIVLSKQGLPDGHSFEIAQPYMNMLTENGKLAFMAQWSERSEGEFAAYLWENGAITPVAGPDTAAPGGGTFTSVWWAFITDRSRDLLIAGTIDRNGSSVSGMYRWSNGNLTSVVEVGNAMPGGGTFQGLRSPLGFGGNDLGQCAFLANVREDGKDNGAVYRLDPDGHLSLVLKQGMKTDLGTILNVDDLFVYLNNNGQILTTLATSQNTELLSLLTPVPPARP